MNVNSEVKGRLQINHELVKGKPLTRVFGVTPYTLEFFTRSYLSEMI